MKIIQLQYWETDYFNDKDYYLVETNLNKFLITRLEFYRGNWYTLAGMQYKATSVRLIKVTDSLYHAGISAMDDKERKGQGTIVKFLEPSDVGVVWKQGSKINPQFWVDINDKSIKLNRIIQ